MGGGISREFWGGGWDKFKDRFGGENKGDKRSMAVESTGPQNA